MWWALAAAAIPYVAQALQSEPWQPHTPAPVMPPDRSFQNNKLLDNAFNPHAELFERSSDVVQENVNRALAKAGLQGSSAGGALSANTQGTLAAKWLEEATSRQRMALDAVNGDDRARTELVNNINNEQYQYGAAGYNRTNAHNAGQVAMYGGVAHGLGDAYGQYVDNKRRQSLTDNMNNYLISHTAQAPSYGTPGPDSSIYGDYAAPANYGRYATPGDY